MTTADLDETDGLETFEGNEGVKNLLRLIGHQKHNLRNYEEGLRAYRESLLRIRPDLRRYYTACVDDSLNVYTGVMCRQCDGLHDCPTIRGAVRHDDDCPVKHLESVLPSP